MIEIKTERVGEDDSPFGMPAASAGAEVGVAQVDVIMGDAEGMEQSPEHA